MPSCKVMSIAINNLTVDTALHPMRAISTTLVSIKKVAVLASIAAPSNCLVLQQSGAFSLIIH